ncbi:MAG: hypothetical protein AB8H79_11720 [Myxococcota bacterium]
MRIASLSNVATSPTAGVPDHWNWTSLQIDGTLVSNAIGDLDWRNPVQQAICMACGTPGCSSSGHVHVSRDDSRVYWTRSQGDPDIHVSSHAIANLGGLAFELEAWRRFHRQFGVAPPDDLPAADERVFLDALLDTVGAETTDDLLDQLREDLLTCTTLTVSQATESVRGLVLGLEADAAPRAAGVVRWKVVDVPLEQHRVECLYLDGRKVLDWPILALYQDEVVLRLGDGLLLIREDVR